MMQELQFKLTLSITDIKLNRMQSLLNCVAWRKFLSTKALLWNRFVHDQSNTPQILENNHTYLLHDVPSSKIKTVFDKSFKGRTGILYNLGF